MRLIGVIAAALMLLTGCAASPDPSDYTSDVKVDTPELRTLRDQAGIEACAPGTADRVKDGLEKAALPCLGGGKDVDPSRLRGPLVVNLWAQWCGPCRKELPYYQAFHEKYAGTVDVLGIDWTDTRPDLALKLARTTGVTYPLVADPQGKLLSGKKGLPVLILVGADGTVEFQQGILIESLAQLESLVEKHLGVPRDSA